MVRVARGGRASTIRGIFVKFARYVRYWMMQNSDTLSGGSLGSCDEEEQSKLCDFM